ncbi:MAG: DNA translocase FtsK 4TM domain-containing protein [Proteobacteria bacterium]|nr:DNA translocase FtsK 4TM domain-containing protein [Pseudomonadota bacterium]
MEKLNNKEEVSQTPKPYKRELKLILYIAVTVFFFLIILTFSPNDPSFFTKSVFPDRINNFFGKFGSYTASLLIQFFGWASLFIPVYLTSILFYSRFFKEFSLNFLRIIFFAVSLLSLGGFLSSLFPESNVFGLKIPAGGFFGFIIGSLFSKYLNISGGLFTLFLIFMISTIIALEKNIFKKIFLLIVNLFKAVFKVKMLKERSEKPEVRAPKLTKTIKSMEDKKDEKTEEEELQLRLSSDMSKYDLPPISILNINKEKYFGPTEAEIKENITLIEDCLKYFDVKGKISEVHPGPLITMYEFIPEPGTKINKIVSLENELSMALKAISLRIIAPIPGKSSIGIELSNKKMATVYIREIIGSEDFTNKYLKIPLCIGKDTTGNPFIADLTKMPHLLIAGSTGSGKSVCINAMILSILFKLKPDEAKFIMIDPKMLELSLYQDIPHLAYPVVTTPEEASKVLKWAIREMDQRYELMAGNAVRNIEQYNAKLDERGQKSLFSQEDTERKKLPYIIIIIDELADLMMVSAKEVENYITRLAQKARAAGIHLIVATQRPSVDVITGLIKANFPARIAFKVASKVDSRTILDVNGAESLLGQGDMLFLKPGTSQLIRLHGALVTENEIIQTVHFWKSQSKPEFIELPEEAEETLEGDELFDDEKYEEAVKIVIESRQASISHLQRRLRIGYNRAARMIERMEREGIVSPPDGTKGREVLR